MAQSGFTPIQLYRSTTPTAVPLAADLVAGELALNLADEKLYFENASGVVKVLADSTYVGTVTSVNASGGTTGLSFSGGPITSSGTLTLAGTLGAVNGGTGQSSYAVGDILFASTTTALSKLADVATGNALISGGVGVAPLYGKIGLTTHVSGTLAVANGGTGASTFTANGILLGNGTSAVGVTAVGTTGQVLVGNTGADPSWATLSGIGVTSFSAGTTGFTPSTATTGAITLAGTLAVANGGTGVTTSTGTGSVVLSASPSFTGTVNFGPAIVTGTGVSTGDAQLELGGNRSGDGPAYMDLHTVAGGDFNARVFRGSGANGNMEIVNAGTGVLSIATNATEKMRIEAGGNVGIGITSPAAKLDVVGNIYSRPGGAAGAVAELNADASSGANGIYLAAGFASGGYGPIRLFTSATERMRIDSSGNVGIGTTGGDFSRTWRLVARQDQNAITNIGVINANTGASASAQISKITGTGNSFVDWGLADNSGSPYDTFSYGSAVQYVSWGFGGSERMRLASSGFVGVGTSTDNGVDKLTVAGVVGSYISGRAGFHLYNGGATAEWFIGQPSASSHNLTFSKLVSSTYTDYVAIDSSGNVGIGNTSPTVTLDVTGGIKTSRTAVTSPATSDGNIFSGTYTPTLTNVANIDIPASTAYTFQYMRVGNVVTVSGKIDVTVTGTGLTRLNVSLPISSNFSAEENCAGTAVMTASSVSINIPASIRADTTNDVAQVQYHGNLTGMAQAYLLTFTYRII